MCYDVKNFGAIGDGQTNTTAHLQSAIDTCAKNGGGTVNIPAGTYVSGTLWIRTNVTLNLESGAILLGSDNFDDFPTWASEWEGPDAKKGRAALICGEGVQNIAVTGRGIIDGRGKVWWDAHNNTPGKYRRPYLVRVVNCKNVLFEGVTMRNSPMWTLSPLACENVVIRGLTINNPADSPNTDGINPESCKNVRISDCHVDVGDDCITIKSGKEDEGRRELLPCENIAITNCTLVHGHGGVVIGSEMSGSVRNVSISNCVFVGTDRGIRIKARRGRGGVVEDIRASDLVMDGVLCPIVVNLFYGCGAWGDKKVTDASAQPVNSGTPRFRRLRYSNITAKNVKWAAAYILGLPEMYVEDLIIENSSFFLDPKNAEAGPPAMAPITPDMCRRGIVAKNVERITLRNIDLSDQLGPAIDVECAHELRLTDAMLRTAVEEPMIDLREIDGAYIRGCCVPPEANHPLKVTGENIVIGENEFELREEVGNA